MRIAIVGAGGMGGYLAARLAAAGEDVRVLARGRHLQAIRDAGALRLVEPEGASLVPADRVTGDVADLGQPDVIILATKAHQAADAIADIRPAVGLHTHVLTLQNGVDVPEMVAHDFGDQNTLIGLAWILVNITGPGEITRYGEVRSFTIGDYEGRQDTQPVADLTRRLRLAGVEMLDSDDVRVDLWRKLCFFNAFSGVTAAARTRMKQVRASEALRRLWRRLAAEAEAVAREEGVPLPDDTFEHATAPLTGILPDEGRASMAHDLERGVPLEIDFLAGAVARRGRALGIETPASETVAAILEPFRAGRPD